MSKNKRTIAIIILSIIIIGMAGVYAYEYMTEKAYQEGYAYGVISLDMEILNSINEIGYVPYQYPINETASINIMLVPQPYKQNQGGNK